jgi:DNA-binding NarL/FixJ family response regulator
MKVTIGIADDHQLFLKSVASLINSFDNFEVIMEALDGEDLLKKLHCTPVKPDIILLDVGMPKKNGIETAKEVAKNYGYIKTVALSMKDDDITIIKMLKAGSCAYLLKDIHPAELEKALIEINAKGYYNADAANINYRRLIARANDDGGVQITEKEKQFLQLACSDLTYKQIAAEMSLAERTIDGYRESLFQKLNVKSRVGMALEALRKGLVTL